MGGDAIEVSECHGTGTALGDPNEVGALKRALGVGRSVPLVRTTIKSSVGHSEGAAGVSDLLQVALTLAHRSATPNLHVRPLLVRVRRHPCAPRGAGVHAQTRGNDSWIRRE